MFICLFVQKLNAHSLSSLQKTNTLLHRTVGVLAYHVFFIPQCVQFQPVNGFMYSMKIITFTMQIHRSLAYCVCFYSIVCSSKRLMEEKRQGTISAHMLPWTYYYSLTNHTTCPWRPCPDEFFSKKCSHYAKKVL